MQKIHRIRINLTSRNVKSLEKVCQELIGRAKSKELRYDLAHAGRKPSLTGFAGSRVRSGCPPRRSR